MLRLMRSFFWEEANEAERKELEKRLAGMPGLKEVYEQLKPLQEAAIDRAKKRVAVLQAEHTEILPEKATRSQRLRNWWSI